MAAETILSLIAQRARSAPHASALFRRRGQRWVSMSLTQVMRAAEGFANALASSGVHADDRLAIMCRTRVEWVIADLGAMIAGVVTVGVDAHASDLQLAQIFEESQPTALIVDSVAQLSRIARSDMGRLAWIAVLDAGKKEALASFPRAARWPEPTRRRRRAGASSPDAMQCSNVRGASLASAATLLYTSGTTGNPRAILYRQEQLAVACRAILAEFPGLAEPGGSTICWLPMAALFQRMMNYVALTSGVAVYVVEDPTTVIATARRVHPTYFVGVPRFFEKVYQRIERKLGAQPAWLRRRVEVALERTAPTRNREASRWRHGLVDRAIVQRLHGLLGRRLRFAITGSAPAPPWLLEYFHRLGILVLEAYGFSENTVPVAANRPDAWRFGSVGKVFHANDVKIADDDEILVRGPGIFDGYRDALGSITPPHLTTDGFLATGDLGRFDAEGFLYIDGRKAEIFKTSGGRQVTPSHIEASYKRIPYIEQIVVVGHGRPYPVALLSINAPLLAAAMRERDPLVRRVGHHPSCDEMKARIAADLEHAGSSLPSHQRVRHFDLLTAPLSLDGGELTSSLKLRRALIERKYRDMIERIYAR